MLPWAPSTTHLRDPESRVPGLGSGVAELPDSLDTQVSRLSFKVGLAALTGTCGTRLGHARQRYPRCGRFRPPDLQGRDLHFAPFMSNTHVRSSNEDLGLVALVSPWALVPRGKAACDISIFLVVQKAFCSHVVL